MAVINYAESYQAELAQAYPYVLHFAALRSTPNDTRFKWDGAQTIKVPTVTTKGRVNGSRDSITVAKRNFDNAWTPLTLRNHRKWSTLVHPMDIDETNQAASIANITRVFNQEQKFPEMDCYMVSKLFADWETAGGTKDTEVINETNILNILDGYFEMAEEANVPITGLMLYLTPHIKKILKNAKDMQRFLPNGDASVRRAVEALDEVKIESVPSALMKTIYDFSEGWKPGVSPKQINIMMAHPTAVITPEKYTFAQLDAPSATTEGKYVYFEESYDDVFLLKNRKNALMFNVEA